MTDEIFSKILTIGPAPKGHGGIASVIELLSGILPDFKLLPTNGPDGLAGKALVLASTLVRLPWERLRGRSVLHIHSAAGKSFVRKRIIMRWGKLLGYKLIFHSHSGKTEEYFRRSGIDKSKKAFDSCAAIITLSKPAQRYFSETFNHPNVRIVHNPILRPGVPTRPDTTAPLTLLFLGTVCDSKGIFDLLEVIKLNHSRWVGRIRLIIGGNGETQRLESFIRENNLTDIVDFQGWVDNNKKEHLFSQSHILVHPTHCDAMPMSILEAMAHGLAVISTPIGGIPEMMEDSTNGFLIPPGDLNRLQAAVDCYLLNPELIDRHGTASMNLAKNFFPEKIREDLRRVYTQVINNG